MCTNFDGKILILYNILSIVTSNVTNFVKEVFCLFDGRCHFVKEEKSRRNIFFHPLANLRNVAILAMQIFEKFCWLQKIWMNCNIFHKMCLQIDKFKYNHRKGISDVNLCEYFFFSRHDIVEIPWKLWSNHKQFEPQGWIFYFNLLVSFCLLKGCQWRITVRYE